MSKRSYYISTGKLECFYTLRYTFEERQWTNTARGPVEVAPAIRDYHVRNLSTDRDEAIQKAKEITGLDLSANFDLNEIERRRDVDWSFFQTEKYNGRSIHEIRDEDPDFLVWFAENVNPNGKHGKTVALVKSLMAHELEEREQARVSAANKEEERRQLRIAKLSELVSIGDDEGRFRDEMARCFKEGIEIHGRAITIVCEIFAKRKGRRNSKAYDAEYNRVATLLEQAYAPEKARHAETSSHSAFIPESPQNGSSEPQDDGIAGMYLDLGAEAVEPTPFIQQEQPVEPPRARSVRI